MTLRQFVIVILVWLICPLAMSQETIVVGDIVSEATGEPVANASVYYQGTKVGTASNDEGSFALRTDLTKKRTLIISAVGYRTQRYSIEPGTMAGIQVALQEKSDMIDEVLVRPGDNPAMALIAAVKAHRQENDRYMHPSSVQAKATTRLFISDLGRRQLQRHLWQNLQAGMIQVADSEYMLPLYWKEQTLQINGNQQTPVTTDMERTLVLSPTDYSALLTLNGNYNFYSNDISLFSHSFLSPLATASATYYRYYLVDSVQQGSDKLYVVHFRTKNPYYATFNGSMEIDSATLALRSIVAEVPRETSVNFLSSVHISQQLAPDGQLQVEQVAAVLDFAIKVDTSHTFPTVLIERQLSSLDYRHTSLDSTLASLNASFSTAEIEAAMDSIQDVPLIRTAQWIATVVNTGYMPTGWYLDFGNVEEMIQFSHEETVRIGLPLRTSERLWKRVCLEACAAYGVKDQAWKGYGRVMVQIPAPRRHVLSAEYRDQYVRADVSDFSRLNMENSVGLKTMDFTMFLINPLYTNAGAVSSALRQRQFQLLSENDWTENIETQFYLRVGRTGYQPLNRPMPDYGAQGKYAFPYQSLGGILRIGFGERKVDGYFRRTYVYGKYPVIHFGAEVGTYSETSMAEGYHVYGRLNLKLSQTVSLGQGGKLDYAADFGCVLGKVPYPLLHHFEANQSYAYDPYRFTLMNAQEFAADKWLSLHLAWNGQGVLFNLIPGVRYLRLRELVTFKIAYGAYAQRHNELQIVNPAFLSHCTSLSTPYVEVGCGIGNILRVLEVYSVWRLTDSAPAEIAPRWAMRFRLNLEL